MNDLIHWHRVGEGPSAPSEPPECCTRHLREINDRRQDEAVHAERQRVILNALHVVETFGENVAVALTGREKELAELLTKHAAEAIRKTGCICPRIDTTTLGGKQSWTRGYDSRCGMHETRDVNRELA